MIARGILDKTSFLPIITYEEIIMKETFDFDKEKKAIGDRIRELRKAKGLSQNELAEILSISQDAVSKIEQGKVSLNLEYQFILANEFNVSHDFLCTGNPNTPLDIIKRNLSFRYSKTIFEKNSYTYPVLEINESLYTFLTRYSKAEAEKLIPDDIKKQWLQYEEKQFEENIGKENSKKVTLIPIHESMILSDEDSQFALDLLNKIVLFEEK